MLVKKLRDTALTTAAAGALVMVLGIGSALAGSQASAILEITGFQFINATTGAVLSAGPGGDITSLLEPIQFTLVHILQRRNNFGIGWE